MFPNCASTTPFLGCFCDKLAEILVDLWTWMWLLRSAHNFSLIAGKKGASNKTFEGLMWKPKVKERSMRWKYRDRLKSWYVVWWNLFLPLLSQQEQISPNHDRLKCLQILLSSTQAGPGRALSKSRNKHVATTYKPFSRSLYNEHTAFTVYLRTNLSVVVLEEFLVGDPLLLVLGVDRRPLLLDAPGQLLRCHLWRGCKVFFKTQLKTWNFKCLSVICPQMWASKLCNWQEWRSRRW